MLRDQPWLALLTDAAPAPAPSTVMPSATCHGSLSTSTVSIAAGESPQGGCTELLETASLERRVGTADLPAQARLATNRGDVERVHATPMTATLDRSMRL
ncbi:hypothetical protein PD653_1163 [Nocardioides sp. PD653]|nr:hypothetical protein PD653B2_0248 [Nocardioides sp. PD653-B2]GAW53760.1 hypothetical protein PD653_1163 [Nocardioides sp. PD653]